MDGDELIHTIDKLYFQNEQDFNLDHLTDKLPENLTSDYLLEYKCKLEKVLNIVTKKVSELILSHQSTYVEELQRIKNLEESISDSIRVCTQGRLCLRFVKEGTAKNGSTIVDHYKQRQSLAQLLDSLNAINDLRRSVFEIRKLIESQEDFPKAIQMCKDGKAMLTEFQEFTCVKEFGYKLNDTIELIGEQVDTVLSKMCLSYDPNTYAKLQMSYQLMDRSEIAVDQLLMHFCSAINSQAHAIVIKHLNMDVKTDNIIKETANLSSESKEPTHDGTNYKKEFQDICKLLTSEQYLHYLLDLCTTFWFIMVNYQLILRWHKVDLTKHLHQTTQEIHEDIKNNDEQSDQTDKEKFKQIYIEQKLVGGLNRLWYDMKRKLILSIQNHDFSCYRFDEFIKILGIVDLVMRIGNEFCGCVSSDDVRDCVNTQALNFFKAYHKSSMDELGMFLENEVWDVVPVKQDFKLVQLIEFCFLRSPQFGHMSKLSTFQNYTHDYKSQVNTTKFFTEEVFNDQIKKDISTEGCQDSLKLNSVIPFEKLLQSNKDMNEDLFGSEVGNIYYSDQDKLPLDKISLSTDSDDEFELELNKDCVEEDEFISSEEDQPHIVSENAYELPEKQAQSSSLDMNTPTSSYLLTRTSGPVLTNSSLNVLRLIGRYIQMMIVLEPISYEILMRIYNLLDHYTMIVYKKFGPDADKKTTDDKNISPKLKIVIRSIRESLIGNQTVMEDFAKSTVKQPELGVSMQQGVPGITQLITNDLKLGQTKSEPMEPINAKKAVAVESLIYLVNQLWNLQEYLESLIPADFRPQLREQFSQSQSIVPDFLKARSQARE